MPEANSAQPRSTTVTERVASGSCPPESDTPQGVVLRELVSRRIGSIGVSTGTATLEPLAEIPYHFHDFSEAVTILEGPATMEVEGRRYILHQLDCIHVPAGTAHRIVNLSTHRRMSALWAFATDVPSRQLVKEIFPLVDRGNGVHHDGDPEYVRRFHDAAPYELAEGASFYDLFAGRFGSVGICGGYGEFAPGSGLPCHTHNYDESITIIKSRAVCRVAGRQYELAEQDTAFVPQGMPHRFLNQDGERMGMIWVYAGSEPERTLVSSGYCDGSLHWPAKGNIK